MAGEQVFQNVLDERQAAVLKALVYEYISTARPVGSRSFVQKYSFNLSPATMRNIMFDLESAGFLMQPHTSAGRVPTDRGYRFYVDSLMDAYEFKIDEMIDVHEEALSREVQLDKMFASITRMLAGMSTYAGIVVTPRADYTVVKHIELVPLGPSEILVILITRTGMILNKKVSISETITRDQLYRFSSYLTAELSGFSLHDVKERLFDAMRSGLNDGVEQHLAIDIAQLALSIKEEPDIIVEGIENILHIPEMTQEAQLKGFLHLVEEKLNLAHILEQSQGIEGVCTLIGDEIDDPAVVGCSIVSSPYRISNNTVGVLGVIGPTRMNYRKVVPLVDYTGKFVSELLTRMSR